LSQYRQWGGKTALAQILNSIMTIMDFESSLIYFVDEAAKG